MGQSNGEMAWEMVSGKELKSVKIGIIVSAILSVGAIIAQLITKNYLLYILSVLLVSDTVIMGVLTGLLLKDKRDFLFCEELSTYSDEIINNTVLGYSGLCITKRYIFKAMQLSKPIDLKQVEWVYRKKVTSNQNSSDNTILCMRNGKKKSISNGIAITDNDFIYKLVKYNNERALIGYSAANRKKYKEIVASENI